MSIDNRSETFHLPLYWVAGIVAAIHAPMIAIGILSEDATFIAIRVIAMLAMMVMFFGVGQLTISPNGLTLYYVNRAAWSDFASAQCVSILGLPYLRLRRSRGWFRTWLVPLYFVGARSIRDALRAHTPDGSPIRSCLEAC